MTYMDDVVIEGPGVARGQMVKRSLTYSGATGFYGHKISAGDCKILKSLDHDQTDPARTVKILGLILDHDSRNFRFDVDEILQFHFDTWCH